MASQVLVYKSKVFTSKPVAAVFPHLNEVDQFGSFSIDVDVLGDKEFADTLEAQAADTLKAAHVKLETNKVPTNALFRDGEYKDEPFRRVSFKMKATRTVKGADVAQAPRLVDAHRNPMKEIIFGGSKVKVAYYLQYTITPTGTFMSPKLAAVQVLEHVGPGGMVSVDQMFDEEDGFTSVGEPAAEEQNEHLEDVPVSLGGGRDSHPLQPQVAASGRDF